MYAYIVISTKIFKANLKLGLQECAKSLGLRANVGYVGLCWSAGP